MAYKIINGVYNVKSEIFFEFDQSGQRGNSKTLLEKELGYVKNCFSNRVFNNWKLFCQRIV